MRTETGIQIRSKTRSKLDRNIMDSKIAAVHSNGFAIFRAFHSFFYFYSKFSE